MVISWILRGEHVKGSIGAVLPADHQAPFAIRETRTEHKRPDLPIKPDVGAPETAQAHVEQRREQIAQQRPVTTRRSVSPTQAWPINFDSLATDELLLMNMVRPV